MFASLIEKLSPTARAVIAGLVVVCVFGLVGWSVYLEQVDLKVGIGIALATLVNGSAALTLLLKPKASVGVELPELEAKKAVAELAKRVR